MEQTNESITGDSMVAMNWMVGICGGFDVCVCFAV